MQAVAWTATLLLSACATLPPLEQRYSQFQAYVLGPEDGDAPGPVEVTERLQLLFGHAFRAARLQQHSVAELDALFRSAELATEAGSAAALPPLEATLHALQRKGALHARHTRGLHEAYLRARRLDDAARLARAHPSQGMALLPPLVDETRTDPAGPTVLEVPASGAHITKRSLDLANGARIVVAWHPQCHFSTRALRDIRADARLSALLRSNAVLVAPAGDPLRLEPIQAWNAANPEYPVAIAWDGAQWPFVHAWAMPTFYFFSEGELVGEVVGWPREGRFDELISNASKLGLLP